MNENEMARVQRACYRYGIKPTESRYDVALKAVMSIAWIPVSERLPKDLEEVVVTWVNRNPPVYYRHEKDKPQTGIAVLYRDTWHWWDSTVVDVLAEYGSRCEIEHISEDIEIIAWQPLPEPYKGGDTE